MGDGEMKEEQQKHVFSISFTTEMVLAILDGRKSMTRRLVKPQPEFLQVHRHKGEVIYDGANRRWGCGPVVASDPWSIGFEEEMLSICPYHVGQLLWVREAWAKVPATAYHHDTSIPHREHEQEGGYKVWSVYKAGWERCQEHWQSGRYMPRWASRILLRVVSVKLERVQDITEEDARKEGVLNKDEFQKLWEKIHKPGAWARNDWVWAVEFEVVKP